MDKYTYNVKAEKIQKLVKKGEYAAAVKIAETVDWEEVHSVRLLTITAAAYERIRDYKGAIELLQMAYDESAVGKRILYKLTGLAIADRDVELAQNYYEMYLQEAPEENGRYLLRYLLAELKGESLDKRIAILETYRKYEFEEEWALRLAELYDEAGLGDACVKLCDEIILWFSVGEYVDAALKLKGKYAPLSAEQQDKLDNREFYEQRYQEVAAEYREKDKAVEEPAADGSGSEDEEPEDEIEQAEEKPAGGPLLPEPKSDAWRERILFVGADNLEQAVPQILSRLNAYHEKTGTDMAVTRIPALKFNKLGMETSRPHIAEKDLIVDGASALSDDLLRDILAYVKDADTTTVFALTDTPTELAYLDNRLGAIIKEEELPDIDTGAPETSDLKLDMDAVMDDEPVVDLGGTTKEIVPQVKAALGENDEPVLDERAAVSDTVKFDKGVVAEAAETAAAAESAVETAAETAAEAVVEAAPVLPEPAVILPENDDDYRQETIEDFFKAQEEAAEKAEEKVEEKAEEVKAAVEEKAEAAQQEVEAVIVAVEGKTNELGEALEEKAEEVRETVEEKAEEVKETAEENAEAAEAKAEAIKETAEETTEEVKEAAEEQVEAIEAKAEEIKETVEEKVEEVKEAAEAKAESAKDILEEAKKAVEEKTEAAAETAAAAEAKAEEAFEDLGGAFEEVKVTAEEKAEAVKETVEEKTEAVEAKAEEAAAAVGTAAGAAAAAAAKAEKEEREIVSEAFAKPEDPAEALRRRALSIPGSMIPESFVTYAKNYLTSIDCVLEEDGEEALMSAAEYRVAEGTALTKEEAENIIEAAADLSEKKGGLFARRYNKEGCLILKTKYIV